jgi:hypothetical protein
MNIGHQQPKGRFAAAAPVASCWWRIDQGYGIAEPAEQPGAAATDEASANNRYPQGPDQEAGIAAAGITSA